jgi:hypothetical protein
VEDVTSADELPRVEEGEVLTADAASGFVLLVGVLLMLAGVLLVVVLLGGAEEPAELQAAPMTLRASRLAPRTAGPLRRSARILTVTTSPPPK